jgi:uncharacterized protein involved in outer membrane biogenesis
VQTTLLGFAIAIILALVTALVGPLLVDWSAYRGQFESRASRLAGREVRITGAIEARLLPTPSLVLHDVELGGANEKARAGVLRLELALGPLARGELRITNARVERSELTFTFDEHGGVEWAAPQPSFDPEGISVEHLGIQDGRIVLIHKASGSRLLLEKVEFRGELRSLLGPLKGDGSFVGAGQHYPYRLSATRLGENGGLKLRLAVDPIDRPLTAEADLGIWVEQGIPRFEGTLQLARLVGLAPAGEQSTIVEPWRLNTRIKGNSLGAVLDQLEFQYGPDERAAKLKGTAQVSFGAQPHASASLASAQMDLDRVLAQPGAKPVAAGRMLSDFLSARPRAAVPLNLSIAIESLVIGGAAMQRVSAEVQLDAEQVDLRRLEFRAPGAAQVGLHGRLGVQPTGIAFAGTASIEANDARTFLNWGTGHSDAQLPTSGPLRFGGKIACSDEQLSIEEMQLELEQMSVTGRLLYAQRRGDQPSRVEAALTTPEVDLDRLHMLAKAVLGDTPFDLPREGAISLHVGRATAAGVQIKQADVKARIDAHQIDIEQLSIADIGGAKLAVNGRIDTKLLPPRGTMTLDLDAQSLDGVLAVLEKFAPEKAEPLRRIAGRASPLFVRATLTVDPGAAGATLASATLKLNAQGGRTLRVSLIGDASTSADAFKHDKLAALEAAKINLWGHIDAEDSQALTQLLYLDRLVAVENRPGRLAVQAKGVLDRVLDVDVKLTSGPLSAATQGKLRLWAGARPSGDVTVTIKNANLLSPRRAGSGLPAEVLPTSLSAQLAFADDTVRLQDIKGTVAGAILGGRLTLGLQSPTQIDGEIELGSLDLPAALATAVGLPTRAPDARQNVAWAADPFEPIFGALSGRLGVKVARVNLTPKLEAREFRGVVHFGQSQMALQVAEGKLGGGDLHGDLILLRDSEGLIGRAAINVIGAEAAELLPGEGTISGRLAFDLATEGSGLSAVALLGSLHGRGSFTLENGKIARLNPAAFAAVMRAVEQGLPIDAAHVRDRLDTALASGSLALALAQGTIVIEPGQARLTNSAVAGEGTELATTASVDVVQNVVDARVVFTGPETLAFANTRPEIVIFVKGPVNAARRTIDAAQFASWLALRSVEQQSRTLDMLEGREVRDVATPPGSQPIAHVDDGLAGPKPSASGAQPLSTRPKPRPRPAAQKPKPTATEEVVRTMRPPPPRQPSSLSEFFFGNH